MFSHQQLNVVDARQQITSSNAAIGNQIIGGTEQRDLSVQNRQSGFAAAVARTRLNIQGQNNGRITAAVQARNNHASIAANGAALAIDSQQAALGDTRAIISTQNPQAHWGEGAVITAAAYGNSLHAGGHTAFISGKLAQFSDHATEANILAPARFVRGPTHFSAEAVANDIQIVGTGVSDQRLGISQTSQGWVGTYTDASAGNAWASAASANAVANRTALYNSGGAQVITIDQSNSSAVNSVAGNYAYDYGDLRAQADGVGNQAIVGNSDIWVQIDNSQINSGGVAVEATVNGHNGYDAYVGANATGNMVSGYACSDCGGVVRANNTQTNSGPVSATATTNIPGGTRAVVTGTVATGNSASFYVTRPGG